MVHSMTIRPSKAYYADMFILILSIVSFDYVMGSIGAFNSPMCTVIMLFPIHWIVWRSAIVMGKTITFSEKGCSVSFCGFTKQYDWKKISVKRLEDYNGTLSYKRTFSEGIFFSIKPIKRPRWMGPEELCMLRCPYTAFFVTFDRGTNTDADRRYPAPYKVDKEVFLNYLYQLGVVPNCD